MNIPIYFGLNVRNIQIYSMKDSHSHKHMVMDVNNVVCTNLVSNIIIII